MKSNQYDNFCEVAFEAKSENEGFARIVAAAFCTGLDPTVEEIADVKTAVSEAVTNSIVHGYNGAGGIITMKCMITGSVFMVEIHDDGVGIENIDRAMEPLFTTKPELERSGMGFSFMEAFMDDLKVDSARNKGTTVTMTKRIGAQV
ncbi:MAG: anti-sigma F factor [Eubacteriales bacterium]|nr:anti-sigma F factor [Eubacteriales bacterium]